MYPILNYKLYNGPSKIDLWYKSWTKQFLSLKSIFPIFYTQTRIYQARKAYRHNITCRTTLWLKLLKYVDRRANNTWVLLTCEAANVLPLLFENVEIKVVRPFPSNIKRTKENKTFAQQKLRNSVKFWSRYSKGIYFKLPIDIVSIDPVSYL